MLTTMRWRIWGILIVLIGPYSAIYLLAIGGHIIVGDWINAGVGLLWTPVAGIATAVIYVELRPLKGQHEISRILE